MRILALVVFALVALALRRDVLVRGVRALDRHGGLASRRGERAYAGVARIFWGLHHRVGRDVASMLGDRRATVLDIGAGPGGLVAELTARLPAAVVTGVEPSPAMRHIAAAMGRAEVDGRAERLPFPDASVDVAVSTLSMHHWDDPARAFAEIWRVLRPGGHARLHDIRFAAYSDQEVTEFARAAGLDPSAVRRTVLDERLLGLRPYALVTISG